MGKVLEACRSDELKLHLTAARQRGHDAEEPLLVHTGMRVHFADTLTAARRVVDPARLRWITSGHASRPD